MTDRDHAMTYEQWIVLQLVGIRYNAPGFEAACEALRAHAEARGFGPDGRPL
jgi:hypothetical protein